MVVIIKATRTAANEISGQTRDICGTERCPCPSKICPCPGCPSYQPIK